MSLFYSPLSERDQFAGWRAYSADLASRDAQDLAALPFSRFATIHRTTATDIRVIANSIRSKAVPEHGTVSIRRFELCWNDHTRRSNSSRLNDTLSAQTRIRERMPSGNRTVLKLPAPPSAQQHRRNRELGR
jgi:hypothetical protein